MSGSDEAPRQPRAFDVDDPRVASDLAGKAERTAATGEVPHRPRAAGSSGVEPSSASDNASADPASRDTLPGLVARGWRWGSLFFGALFSLAALAAGVWFARFVAVAIGRDDWVGWVSLGLLSVSALAAIVLAGREVVGIYRLARLGRLRRDADRLVAVPDLAAERRLVARLVELQSADPTRAWAVATFRAHLDDVHDAGGLLALAERDLLRPLDTQARTLILQSAKRVATVTALSPVATLSVAVVLIENLRLMRALAGVYGGRPQFVGSLRLARDVVITIVASGGLALTDDLLGQFLGQDILRRLSRRLGEGAFNGALTARLGAATVDIVRPLPFIEVPAVRARDVMADLFRRNGGPGSG